MIGRPGRSWGFWTEAKLSILDGYLDSFVTASSSQAERVYLDAFAGEGAGLSRLTGEEFKGSARIALEVRPPDLLDITSSKWDVGRANWKRGSEQTIPDARSSSMEGTAIPLSRLH